MKKAIGIDLGTSHSSAAHVDGGFPMMIEISEEGYSIPSVVSFDEKGQQSKDGVHHVRNSKRMFKRSLSNTSKSALLDKSQQIFTYDIADSPTHNILLQIKKQTYTLEDISAEIIKEVKQSVEQKINQNVDAVVLTVPAYFNELQRKSIRVAGELAGLEVLRVINEPTAAALAYGFQQDMNARIAVYDFGGGTFDLSMIDIQGSVFEVIACGGNPMLGGIDLDDCILHWIFEQVLAQSDLDISHRVDLYEELRQAAERAKIDLSSKESTTIDLTNHLIPNIDKEISITLSRSELEQMTEHLVTKTIECFDQLLMETATIKEELDKIILVGGQSKMPLVQKKLQDWFGREIDFSIHPDEAVALGGALMAEAIVHQQENQQMFSLVDVLPLQIGIQREDGEIAVLFEKHTPLPTRRKYVIQSTKRKQRTLRFSLFQKNANQDQRNYDKIGDYYITDLRSLEYSKIELEFVLADDGELSVSGRCIEKNQPVKISIQGIGTYAEFPTEEPLPSMEIDTGSDQETNEEITNKETTNYSSHEQYATPTLDETVSQTIKTSETAVANIDEDWMVAQSPNKETPISQLDVSEHADVIPSDVEQTTSIEEISAEIPVLTSQAESMNNPSKEETEPIQDNADLELTSELINDGKEELQEITNEEELVERSLFDQYELGDQQQPKTNTTSAFISTPEIPSNENDMDLDEIPLWSNNTNVSNTSPKDQTIIPEAQPLWGNQAKTTLESLPEEKSIPNLWSKNTPETQEETTPHIGQLWGGSDALTKEENVETTSDELSQDSWLVENNLQLDQDNFFAELTEETPPEFLSTQKSLPQNTDGTESQDPLFIDEVSSVHTEETEQIISNIEEDTLQIPNYLEFGNDDISKETKTPSKDIFESHVSQESTNDDFDPFSELDISDTEINFQEELQNEVFSPNNETNESQDSVQSIFSFTPSQSGNTPPSPETNINPTQFESQETSSPLFPTSSTESESSDPFAAFDSISQDNDIEEQQSNTMFDDNSDHFGNEDDPFSNFFDATEQEVPNPSEMFSQVDQQVTPSKATQQPSAESQWTSWSAESSQPTNSQPEPTNTAPFHQGMTNQEISFPMAGMGETAETSENMFEDSTSNADPFSFHLDDTPEGAQNASPSESNPFNQVPRKEERSINEEEWLTNQSMYEQPEDLGSITEELQLHRKPNIIQKAWTWFTGLW